MSYWLWRVFDIAVNHIITIPGYKHYYWQFFSGTVVVFLWFSKYSDLSSMFKSFSNLLVVFDVDNSSV